MVGVKGSTIATIALAIFLGAAVAALTEVTVAAVGLAALTLVAAVLPERQLLPVTLAVMLLVPFDNLSVLRGEARAEVAGAFLLVAGGASLLHWKRQRLTPGHGRARVAYFIWIVTLFALLAIQRDVGVLRVAGIWIIALGMYVWVCALPDDIGGRTRDIATVIGVVGAIEGLAVLADRLTDSTLLARLPGYVPTVLAFGENFGLRASGLAGHPLRLGTLCMLAVIICTGMAMDAAEPWPRIWWIALGLFSLAGLLLSGARGAWVGLACAFAVVAVSRAWSGEAARRPATSVGLAATIAATWFAFRDLIADRLADVGSEAVTQRIGVIDALSGLSRFPLLGAGFSGYATVLYSVGLRYSSVENEYLLSFLSGGAILVSALLWLVVDTLLLVRKALVRPGSTVFAAMAIAMIVNIATYNSFSGTTGPALFSVVLASLALRGWHEDRAGH